jgi:AIG2-like family
MSTCNIETRLLSTPTLTSTMTTADPEPLDPLPPHYFAIGSMMNCVSVRNRNLQLEANQKGQPAELLDHQLVFYGCHGFAEVVPKKGASLHGVVYLNVSDDQMKELDHVERDYIRKRATARLYHQDTRISVSVYCRTELEMRKQPLDQPPSARYLQVLTEGAEHYGVDSSYIQFLRDHPCRPRPDPSEYLAFTEPHASMPTMTRQEAYQNGTGLNGHPLYLTCGPKVIEFRVTPQNQEMVQEFTKTFSQYGDRKVELCMSRLLYDPQFGCPASLEDVTPEHAAYTEHMMCDIIRGFGQTKHWDTVARLVD